MRRNLTGCQCLKKIRVFRPESHSVRSANTVINVYQNLRFTRVHSSRIRTARCSGRLGGVGACPGEGGVSAQEGVCLKRCLQGEGGVCPGRLYTPRGQNS